MPDVVLGKPHYTLVEFSALISVSYATAKRMVAEGAVQRTRIRSGGRFVILRDEVRRHLKRLGVAA